MNVAFQALLLFILILPGLLLRSKYNGRIAKELVLPQNYTPFSREAIIILISAVLLNFLWILIANSIGHWFGFNVDLNSVMYLLMGDYRDPKLQELAIHAVTNQPIKVAIYFLTLYFFSMYLGYKLHTVIRKNGLDKKYKLFRFNNQWHYLLTGEIMEFPDMNDNPTEVDFVSVSAVVDSYLYIGNVADYELDGQGKLARLTLKETYRRMLSDDADGDDVQIDLENDPRYYRIKGDFFIIDCENTRNINIDYWYLPEEQATD